MTEERKVILDLEMTGLNIDQGDRIVEVGVVELLGDEPTGRNFHAYINPLCPVPPETTALHGLTNEFLADKPTFDEIAAELSAFIGDAQIIIFCHTKPGGYTLDERFLNKEMKEAGQPSCEEKQWLNVREWAARMYTLGSGSLNQMLDQYEIKHDGRSDKGGHGALVDAQLLAELYPHLKRDFMALKMTKRDLGPSLF